MGSPFTPEAIRTLRRRLGLSAHPARRPPGLPVHAWGIAELAGALDISPSTVYLWRKRGVVHSRWDPALKRWVVWADDAELDRLKAYSRQSVGEKHRQEWLDAQSSLPPVPREGTLEPVVTGQGLRSFSPRMPLRNRCLTIDHHREYMTGHRRGTMANNRDKKRVDDRIIVDTSPGSSVVDRAEPPVVAETRRAGKFVKM